MKTEIAIKDSPEYAQFAPVSPETKLAMITDAAKAGKTAWLCTYSRALPVTQKTFDKFAKAGFRLFKIVGESLYMASGRNFVCVDFCAIRIS